MAAWYRLPASLQADSVSFSLGVCLSVISVLAAGSRLIWVITRIAGLFPLLSDRIWEILASGTSMLASVLLLAVVLSRSDSHWCQIAHVDMLIVNICMVGIFEFWCFWYSSERLFPRYQRQIAFLPVILNFILCIGFCICSSIGEDYLAVILVFFGSSSFLVYIYLFVMYIRLQKRTQRLIPHLLASIISCGSVAVITIVFLAYGGARQTHRVLSTSIVLITANIVSIRIPGWKWAGCGPVPTNTMLSDEFYCVAGDSTLSDTGQSEEHHSSVLQPDSHTLSVDVPPRAHITATSVTSGSKKYVGRERCV